ncbi:hypothetical protein C4579_01160 [Candidatus Microgenomates bacterium]|nr:MAG: hypothetical protein C4579_01160 [Candidatus Microgenomates bacterium]
MKDFATYLNQTQEVGYVTEVKHTILYVTGLPHAKLSELVIFETGELGQIVSMDRKYAEVILFSRSVVRVGMQVARTGSVASVTLSNNLLGKSLNPLGEQLDGQLFNHSKDKVVRQIDVEPLGITERKPVDQPLITGVSLVDLVIPLGIGQRELVIGDRKTGKTVFLLQAMRSQLANNDMICVYAGIAKWRVDIIKLEAFFESSGLKDRSILVSSAASDAPGLIFLTPYTAMTIAEYFRDQGKDVLIILDDLTRHAQFYREITLLARRFPGRSSYPGDIFYVHAKLLERAGNFKKGSITCLPVAESIGGDLSGYIQTNIMSMTDGHIFFDSDYFTAGKRPAINPFLSVTRVGLQAHSQLLRDISRQLSRLLVRLEELSKLMHFGVEISADVKNTLALGERINEFFRQSYERIIPLPMSVMIIAFLWFGRWKELTTPQMRQEMEKAISRYQSDNTYREFIDRILEESKSLSDLQVYITNEKI